MIIRLGKISLRLSDFPNFLNSWLVKWGAEETEYLEMQGIHLTAFDFPEEDLKNFIKKVCRWGNYAGIGGRVLNQNDIGMIRENFISACKALNSKHPDIRKAISKINQIKNLGTPSFASKHLRMLQPQICPVLDSIIYKGIAKYPFDPEGYAQFSGDCLEIASNLQKNRIVNPRAREAGKWFAADVEGAIFEYLQTKT